MRPICEIAEAVEILDGYAAVAGALAERAIARAWDRGRLAFADPQLHPFEAEVRGLLARQHGRAAAQLEAAQAALRETTASLRAREAAIRPAWTPLQALAEELGLSPMAQELLMLVAAPAVRGELARVYAILTNEHGRAGTDELLLQQLVGGDAQTRYAVTRELDADAPLVRYGLLQVAANKPRPFAGLQVEPLVLRRLRGEPVGRLVGEQAELRAAGVALADVVAPADAIDACRRALDTGARLVVRGQLGSGRRTLLAALAESSGRRLVTLDAGALPGHEALGAELKRALLCGFLPCVSGVARRVDESPEARDRLVRLLAAHPGPLALRLSPDERPPLEAGWVDVTLPRLDGAARTRELERRFAAAGRPLAAPDELGARYRIGPGLMSRAAEAVARELPQAASPAAVQEAASRALLQHLDVRLSTIARRVTRLATWDEVILPDEVAEGVRGLIARVRHHHTVFGRWGFDRAVSTGRGLTALFEGGPGTGKTLVAGLIARELGLDLYRVDLSSILSKWIGETERNLAQVFDAAEDGQVILLFDEADSLFAKRTEVKSSTDRYANAEVNFLLQRLDAFEGIALLTSNLDSSIDPAFKRRLSVRLRFPFPDEEQRARLWERHLPSELPRAADVDVSALAARHQLSGGYVRNVCLRAAFLAAETGAPVDQSLLETAVRQEYRDLGRISEGTPLD